MVESSHESKTDQIASMRDLITGMVRSLVDKPNEIAVDVVTEGDLHLFRLRVAPEDVGKVIGKQGRTARSLRTILSAASMKTKLRFSLDIVEEANSPSDSD